MNFSINGRHQYSVIKKADEIKFNYADRNKIMDLIENYSDKIIVLDLPEKEREWETWQMYSEKFAGFHIALHDLRYATEFNEHNINWYWPYPITSFYELSMIIDLHPSFVLIGAPLTFDLTATYAKTLDDNAQKHIPMRMVVNVAHPEYLQSNGIHGICGQWVRPEDLVTYSQYIDTFEFAEVNLQQEEVLLDVYSKNRTWPGNLNIIIKNLNYNVDNRAIPDSIATTRMNCKHRCWAGESCHYCVSAFHFANFVRQEKQRRDQEAAIDNN